MRGLALLACLIIGCDDPPGDDVVGPGAGSGGDSLVRGGYVDEMVALEGQVGTLIKDINDMLDIWNATSNRSFAAGQTSSLLATARNIKAKVVALNPTQKYTKSHATFISMMETLEAMLVAAGSFFATDSQDSLLTANIKLREADRLREDYNSQINE